MKNEELYKACKLLCQKATKILRDSADEKGIVPQEFSNVPLDQKQPREITSMVLSKYPYNISYLYNENKYRIESLKEFQKCKKLMEKDSVIKKHLNKMVGSIDLTRDFTGEYCLKLLILLVIRSSQSFEFSKKVFEKSFLDMEKFFYSDKIHYYHLVLIENFHCDKEKIILQPNIKIIRMPKWGLLNLCYIIRDSWEFKVLENIRLSEHAIQMEYEENKVINDIGTTKIFADPYSKRRIKSKNISNIVISALRTFKTGTIRLGIEAPAEFLKWQPIADQRYELPDYLPLLGKKYTLNRNEIPRFQKFFRKFSYMYETNETFRVCINRFNYANDIDLYSTDKLIDYMIAFESLYLNDNLELGYKLSVRVACFLGRDKKEKEQIFKEIKKAYDIRSRMVHGRTFNINAPIKFEKRKVSFEELLAIVESHLRNSIYKLLNIGRKPNWDKIVLIGNR